MRVDINDEAKLFQIRNFITFQHQSDQIRRQIEKISQIVLWFGMILDSIIFHQKIVLENNTLLFLDIFLINNKIEFKVHPKM